MSINGKKFLGTIRSVRILSRFLKEVCAPRIDICKNVRAEKQRWKVVVVIFNREFVVEKVPIVLATSTFYKTPDELRFRLACQMIQTATNAGYPVIDVDGSTEPAVREKLIASGAVVFPQFVPGMGPGRRQMFFHAMEHCRAQGYDDAIIVWLEPEKVDVVRSVELFVSPLLKGADVVILKRSRSSLEATYPAFQVESETLANEVYNEAIGREGYDPMSGPVAFRLSMAEYFVCNNPKEFGLEDTYVCHYAALLAMADGHNVVSSPEIDFHYPSEQREEEEKALTDVIREKRKWQLDTLSHAYRTLGARVKQ